MITYLDRVSISLVGVRIKQAFNLNNTQFGWVVGAFALSYAVFEIPSGMLGDRIGQRKVFIRIVLGWSVFTALTGVVFGFVSLLITRFLFGMGESGAFPTSSGAISKWFPSSETGRSMSSLFMGQYTGGAIAPLIVVPIAIAFGWRAPFFVNGLIGIIWVLICYNWYRDEPGEMKGISIHEIQFIEKNRRYIRNNRDSFSWGRAFKNRTIRVMVLSFFCSQWALYFYVAWMPVYLQQGRHFSEHSMKMITSSLFILGIAGSWVSGLFCDWLANKKSLGISRRFIGSAALILTAISFFITARSFDKELVVVSLITGCFFFSSFATVAFSTCVDIAGDYAGTVTGIMNCSGQVGAFFLSIAFGRIVDIFHNFNTPLLVIACVVFIGGLIWIFIDPGNKIIIGEGG